MNPDKKRRPDNTRSRRGREVESADKLVEKVLLIKRVSKKTSGGSHVSFTALVAVGDRNGRVGVGLKRGLEVPSAIKKAIIYAKKHMISVPIYKNTVPHDVRVSFKSASLVLRPAPEGAGLKAGSVVRSILSLCGITNASAKILGSRNQITNTYSVLKALSYLRKREDK